MTRARYRIQSLGGGRPKVEKLIRAHGDWQELKITQARARVYEERDHHAMLDAAENKVAFCPKATYHVERNTGVRTIRIRAFVGGVGVGHLDANESGGTTPPEYLDSAYYGLRPPQAKMYVVGSASVELPVLVNCPGLGTRLYEAAAKEACRRGGVLAGSDLRSPYSEAFWQRQVKNHRAKCHSDYGRAAVYSYPLQQTVAHLDAGRLTVPQYNKLIRRLPANPEPRNRDDDAHWPGRCGSIYLRPCKGPKEAPVIVPDNTLRGLRKRARR